MLYIQAKGLYIWYIRKEEPMRTVVINQNDAGQRLDKFLLK